REDQLAGAAEAPDDGLQRRLPAVDGERGEERLAERDRRRDEELAEVHAGGRLLAHVGDARAGAQGAEDELALCDAAAPRHRDEGARLGLVFALEPRQLARAAEELARSRCLLHEGRMSAESKLVKS